MARDYHGGDMLLGAQAPHGLPCPLDASGGNLVKALGLNQSEGHIPVQQGIVGQVDPLLEPRVMISGEFVY